MRDEADDRKQSSPSQPVVSRPTSSPERIRIHRQTCVVEVENVNTHGSSFIPQPSSFSPFPSSLVRGIGDDAAVFKSPAARDVVVSTDLLVEDVDFRRDTTRADLLGHKALAVSLSDIAAMGARPRWALLSLGYPLISGTQVFSRVLRRFLQAGGALWRHADWRRHLAHARQGRHRLDCHRRMRE